MGDTARAALRYMAIGSCFWLPRSRRRNIERWLRGREEYLKLQKADWVLMSWGKSGRTWFRVMISRFYQVRYRLDASLLLDFDNLHRKNPAIPRVFFTHNNYLRDYTGNWESKQHFIGKKIVLLVRDPRDVAVSQFFQWQYRMHPRKKYLNNYPTHGSPLSLYDFVMDTQAGLPRIIEYFNEWARATRELNDMLIIRYEDLRADTERVMTDILDFVGTPPSREEVAEIVEFARFDNMKKMETQAFFQDKGGRVKPGDQVNPQSFKTRRAKVGGYRDDFTPAQLAELDNLVNEKLNPLFGYCAKTKVADSAPEPCAVAN